MKPLARMTPATADVLGELLLATEPIWGLIIVKQTGRPAGSIYPILERLERLGWVTSEWEIENERNGPRRRFYKLSDEGKLATPGALQRLKGAKPQSVAGVSNVKGGLMI